MSNFQLHKKKRTKSSDIRKKSKGENKNRHHAHATNSVGRSTFTSNDYITRSNSLLDNNNKSNGNEQMHKKSIKYVNFKIIIKKIQISDMANATIASMIPFCLCNDRISFIHLQFTKNSYLQL